jgi:hypothetical protein
MILKRFSEILTDKSSRHSKTQTIALSETKNKFEYIDYIETKVNSQTSIVNCDRMIIQFLEYFVQFDTMRSSSLKCIINRNRLKSLHSRPAVKSQK